MTVQVDRRKLDSLIGSLGDELDDWLFGVAEQINNDIKLSFGRSPSLPGDPPGIDTGTLLGSMRPSKEGFLHYRVQDGVEYGIWLEDGTETIDGDERIAPRPFVGPVFMEWRESKLANDLRQSGIFD